MGRHLSPRYSHVILVSGYPIYLFFYLFTLSIRHNMAKRFPAKKNAGSPKASLVFPPRKHIPPPVGLTPDSLPPPLASVRAEGAPLKLLKPGELKQFANNLFSKKVQSYFQLKYTFTKYILICKSQQCACQFKASVLFHRSTFIFFVC